MTAGKLIELLQNVDSEVEVVLWSRHNQYGGTIKSVQIDGNDPDCVALCGDSFLSPGKGRGTALIESSQPGQPVEALVEAGKARR